MASPHLLPLLLDGSDGLTRCLADAGLPVELRHLLTDVLAAPSPSLAISAREAWLSGLQHRISTVAASADDRAILWFMLATQVEGQARDGVMRLLAHSCLESVHPLITELPTIFDHGTQLRIRGPRQGGTPRPAVTSLTHLEFALVPLALAGLAKPVLDALDSLPNAVAIRTPHLLLAARLINAITIGRETEALAAFEVYQPVGGEFTGDLERDTLIQQLLPLMWYQQALLGGIPLELDELRDRFLTPKLSPLPTPEIFRRDLFDLVTLPCADVDGLVAVMQRPHADRLNLTSCNLVAYNPVRAALCLGELDMAAGLLSQRLAVHADTWLDHLFWMRLHLADRDRAPAVDRLRRTLEGADRYGARGRVEIELRLSRELALLDLAELMGELREVRVQQRPEAPSGPTPGQLVGDSAALAHVRGWIASYADATAPVLILGETGTGKDLVARQLHAQSRRHAAPFVAVNCAAIAENLLEAELFGHVQGAYTGADSRRPGLIASAGAGTLFLDEIGDTGARFQSALLRLLENQEYRPIGSDRAEHVACRIVAATNVDLDRACDEGRFRRDLLYRLQQLPIVVPPLRHRREDIPLLVQVFLSASGLPGCRLDPELMQHLMEQRWPGNVRQLRNEIERLRLHNPGRTVLGMAEHKALPGARQPTGSRETTRFFRRPDHAVAARTPVTPAGGSPLPAYGHGNPQMALQQRILDLFTRYARLTRKQMMELAGISSATATRHLNALCAEGRLRRVCPTPAPRTFYFVAATPTAEVG